MEGKQDRITIIILLIGEASGVFAGFCPSWFTVSSPFFHEQDAKAGNVKRIRWGEAAATAIVLATGGAVSRSMKDPVPLLAAAGIAAVFVGGYEYMIAHPATEEGAGEGSPGETPAAELTPAQAQAAAPPVHPAPPAAWGMLAAASPDILAQVI